MSSCQVCDKPATLRCPTCIKKSLPDSHFCSQQCFKSSWGIHKLVHNRNPLFTGKYNPWPDYNYTGPLRPVYPLTQKRMVPSHIVKTDYADDPKGFPRSEMSVKGSTKIQVLNAEEIEKMRVVCRIGREVLEEGAKVIKVGATTDEIDRVIHDACMERDSYPSPLNYFNFPKSCCTSVNEVICHGIPDQYELQDGDICNIDVSCYHDGFHSDLNETYCVGNVDANGVKLVKNARRCLDEAIKLVQPGALYRDLGNTISKIAEEDGFSVVRSYCGHGINSLFHAAPNVPHYARNKAVGVMKPGQCFTIEPMINEGKWQDTQWNDGWTAVTVDGKRSAQFEETLLVTETGVEILTAKF
ncbi:peptidase M24, structural domain-containing protein [Globomyces pollinis-pini]|nr:peptidase M24, structural domain-containing protein [Globomyces pollinis-pini]